MENHGFFLKMREVTPQKNLIFCLYNPPGHSKPTGDRFGVRRFDPRTFDSLDRGTVRSEIRVGMLCDTHEVGSVTVTLAGASGLTGHEGREAAGCRSRACEVPSITPSYP